MRYCPICKTKAAYFIHYGQKYRPDARCPTCNSLERHRFDFVFLKKKTDLFSGNKKVLHFAPEKCFKKMFTKLFENNYITADLYAKNAQVKMDIMNIKFPDNTFDFIYCCHVLEHVDNDVLAMQELYRVLKYNGHAIINVPITLKLKTTYEDKTITSPDERLKHFGQSNHVCRYGSDYIDRLKYAGFTVKKFLLKDLLSKKDIKKFGLSNIINHPLFYCSKTQ